MNTTFNFGRSNNASLSSKLSYERLLVDADRLFSVGWLIQRLLTELQSMLTPEAASEHHLFFYSIRQQAERWFVWSMLGAHQSSLAQVKAIHQMFPEKELFYAKLREEREAAIEEFSALLISKRWDSLRDDDRSWREFARVLFGLDKEMPQMTGKFFPLVDYICVITDVLCGKSSLYFLDTTDADKAALQQYIQAEEKGDPDLDSISARAALKSFLKEPWFDKFCVDKKKYSAEWREHFIDALLESEKYGQKLIDEWTNERLNRRSIIRGNIIGCLKEAHVFAKNASALGMARAILYPNESQLPNDPKSEQERKKKSKTLSSYIGNGIDVDYYYWVMEYVEGID